MSKIDHIPSSAHAGVPQNFLSGIETPSCRSDNKNVTSFDHNFRCCVPTLKLYAREPTYNVCNFIHPSNPDSFASVASSPDVERRSPAILPPTGAAGAAAIRQHSSDVEQPLCRRTRADSSPAAGSNLARPRMTARTGKGTAMQAHKAYWRIQPFHVASPRVSADLNFRIVEVRKLLRTDLSIQAIADQLGVGYGILLGFIKRRQLCNLSERRTFISRKASLAKLPEEIE